MKHRSKKLILLILVIVCIGAVFVAAGSRMSSTSTTTDYNYVSDDTFEEAIIKNIRLTANEYQLTLKSIKIKESTDDKSINVIVDNYKNQSFTNEDAIKALSDFTYKYSTDNPDTTPFTVGYYMHIYYMGYKDSSKETTCKREIVAYDDYNKIQVYSNKINVVYDSLDSTKYCKDLYALEEVYNATIKDNEALEEDGYTIEKYHTMYKKKSSTDSSKTTTSSSNPSNTTSSDNTVTNYDPNDYGEAADYSSYDDFWADYDDELDEDDAREIWDYYNE